MVEKSAGTLPFPRSGQYLPNSSVGDFLLSSARALESDANALLDKATVDDIYQKTLQIYIGAKGDQLERIEDKLELMLSDREASLQRLDAHRPGLFALPRTRDLWRGKRAAHLGQVQSLRERLAVVRDIKEGVSGHPTVDELALRKMRSENPRLVECRDALHVEERAEVIRAQLRNALEKSQSRRTGLSLSQSQSLSLS